MTFAAAKPRQVSIEAWKVGAFERGLLFFARQRARFDAGWRRELASAILSSPYLDANNLNYRFSGTQGYSIIFRRDGIDAVRRDFACFGPYLDAVLRPACNAFFLNPLVIREDEAGVAPHVDRSLRSVTRPAEPPNPRLVSVLYVEVPQGMRGGELMLFRGLLPVARLRPEPGTLLEFNGSLRHCVKAVHFSGSDEARISLVCEQYRLDEELLARIPQYTVRSMRPFESFLQAEMERTIAPGASTQGIAPARPNPAPTLASGEACSEDPHPPRTQP
jgi:hypothetical protein